MSGIYEQSVISVRLAAPQPSSAERKLQQRRPIAAAHDNAKVAVSSLELRKSNGRVPPVMADASS